MRLDSGAAPGEPFEGDYPGHEHDDSCRSVHQAVSSRLADLSRRRVQPEVRRTVLETLRTRRAGRAADLVQFDVLPREVGFDHLLATGEMLLSRASYEQPAARAVLDAHGFAPVAIERPELSERVVRVVNPALDAATVDSVARQLRQQGYTACVDHVVPLGPVIKELGGAAPTEGPGTAFDQYQPQQQAQTTGAPVRVGIIDCGITAEVRSDGWLARVPRNGNIDPLDDLPRPDGYLDLNAGHGTFVAGIIAQVAPGADIRVYRALDSDGLGSEVAVATAMIKAVKDDGCQILNLSLGGQSPDDVPPVAMAAALEVIAEIGRERGTQVVVVAAAGNYGDQTPCWPAAYHGVVSVAALGPDLRPAPWSSHGYWVTCSTIGQGVRSTYVEGRQCDTMDPHPDVFPADAWAIWNGTSFAAPQIAGAVARIARELDITPQQALVRLLRTGRPVPDFGQALRILPGL